MVGGVAGHGERGVDVAVAAALARGSVPHAVGVGGAGDGSGVLDTARCEAASEARGGVDEHAARVGDAVGRAGRNGDGFAGVDAVSTNPGAVVVAAALVFGLDLRAVGQALSIDPLAARLRAARSLVAGVLAASCAEGLGRVPLAEFLVGFAGSGGGAVLAFSDALASDGVDGASSVVLAGFEVGCVSSRATFLADSVDEAAFGCGIADGGGLARALRRAVFCGGVPRADGGGSSARSRVAAGT